MISVYIGVLALGTYGVCGVYLKTHFFSDMDGVMHIMMWNLHMWKYA